MSKNICSCCQEPIQGRPIRIRGNSYCQECAAEITHKKKIRDKKSDKWDALPL